MISFTFKISFSNIWLSKQLSIIFTKNNIQQIFKMILSFQVEDQNEINYRPL